MLFSKNSLYVAVQVCLNHITLSATSSKYIIKEVIITIYEQMLAESKRLEAEINSLRLQLSELPEGKLLCVPNGKYSKWYIDDGHKRIYLPKTEQLLAEKLSIRKYLTLKLQDLECEKNFITHYLKQHSNHNFRSELLLTKPSEYRKLLSSHFLPNEKQILNWLNTPFVPNPKHPEQLIHQTPSGHIVRSKSEVIIDTLLYVNQIPFRYECPLQLGDVIIYPDFTILHPKRKEIFYWEHFGLMDNPVYCQHSHSKLQLYTSNGIIPTINLITTYETKDNPLDSTYVKRQIEHYFL